MNKVVRQILEPLSNKPLQAYLDNRIQLFDVIESILLETGPADIYITTFSTSEEFLRKMFRFRQKVFDDVYLGENHSKVILIANEKWSVSIVTSQNQTRGNRAESGVISTDKAIFLTLMESLSSIIQDKTMQLNGLFNRTNQTD